MDCKAGNELLGAKPLDGTAKAQSRRPPMRGDMAKTIIASLETTAQVTAAVMYEVASLDVRG